MIQKTIENGDSPQRFGISGSRLLPIVALYCLWVIISLLVLYLGSFIPYNKIPVNITVPVSTVSFIILASFITAGFMVYQERHLRDTTSLRYFSLVFTVLIAAGLFLYVRVTGKTNNLIFIIGTANLLMFANLLGTWIVNPLKRPAELVPVCVVMSLTDLFSVLGGPTQQIAQSVKSYYVGGMKGPTPVGDFLLFKVAVPGYEKVLPIFGVADWIIVAFLVAAVVKFRINDNLVGKSLNTMVEKGRVSIYLPVSALGLMAAVLLAQFSGIALPALPIISFFFLSYIMVKDPNAGKLKGSDWRLILLFSVVMIGLFAVLYYK